MSAYTVTRERPTRIGLLGTGFAAACHADALRRLPDVELVGVASSDRARAEDAARRFGIPRAYDDARRLIDDPDVDAVHVCTVNRAHAEQAASALRAGKHVLCEKPLGVSSEETGMLAALSAERIGQGIVSAVAFQYRHYPLVQQIRIMLAEGTGGGVHFVHGGYMQDWLLLKSDWNWRLDADENGVSRAVADIGTHWIDLVQHVTGERVREIFADLAVRHPVRERASAPGPTFSHERNDGSEEVAVGGEDYGTVLLRFENGARGAFTVSQVSAGRKNGLTLHIDAADTGFAWNQEQPDRAWIGRRQAPNLELLRDPEVLEPDVAAMDALPAGHPAGWRDALHGLMVDFYAAVRRKHSRPTTFATFADAHRSALLVEAILRSDREQAWTAVDRQEAAS